jgi:hypothetical protein
MRFIFLFVLFSIIEKGYSDVFSTTGEIKFMTEDTVSAKLTSVGLGIGNLSPSANLHVAGNALITKSLSIGGENSAQSNLMVNGTMAITPITYSTPTEGMTLGNSSMLLVNPSSHINVAIPHASTVLGRVLQVKNISSSSNLHLMNLIDQNEFITLEGSGMGSIKLISTSTGWMKIDGRNYTSQILPTGNLQLWYDSSDIDADYIVEGLAESGISSGCVILWKNKAGNSNYNLTHQVETAPQYVTSGTSHGLGQVQFNASANTMLVSSSTFTVDSRITMVVAGNLFKSAAEIRGYLFALNRDDFYLARHVSQNGLVVQHPSTVTPYAASNLDVLTLSSDNTSSQYKLYSGNVEIYSTSSSDSLDGAGVASQISLGSRSHTVINYASTSDVYEILFFNKILTSLEFESIVQYLKAKWGI